MSTVAPTTEISAVNSILDTIGEAPVNSLANSTSPDVTRAIRALEETKADILSSGWWFNRETRTISADSEGIYTLPANTLSAAPLYEYQEDQYVLRGIQLYDLENNTFDGQTGTIEVELVLGLQWTELPEEARRYIWVKAARLFAVRSVGAPFIYQVSARDEAVAMSRLNARELNTTRPSAYNRPRMLHAFRSRSRNRY